MGSYSYGETTYFHSRGKRTSGFQFLFDDKNYNKNNSIKTIRSAIKNTVEKYTLKSRCVQEIEHLKCISRRDFFFSLKINSIPNQYSILLCTYLYGVFLIVNSQCLQNRIILRRPKGISYTGIEYS